MKYRRVLCLSLVALLLAIAYDIHRGVFAQSPSLPTSMDVCQSAVKRSVPIAAATSTTVPGVTASTSTTPLVICGLSVGLNTSSSFQFIAGTGTVCGTNTEQVTGPYPGAGIIGTNPLGTLAIVPTGKDLCLKFTGTGGGGAFTYAYGGLTQPTTTSTPTFTPTATPT